MAGPQGFLDACAFTPTSSGSGTWTVSAAIQGYNTPANAGAVNASVYSYRAESADKSQWEIGHGTYTVSGTTLSRTPIYSSNSNAAVSFTAAPNIYVTLLAEDLASAIYPVNAYAAGNYYWSYGLNINTGASVALGANKIYWFPVVISAPITIDQLGARVIAASASGNFSVALYANSPSTGRPTGAPLCQTGNLSTTSTGVITGATTGSYSVTTPGVYWIGVMADNATVAFIGPPMGSSFWGATVGESSSANLSGSATTAGGIATTTNTYSGGWPTSPAVTDASTTTAQGALPIFHVASVP